MLFPLVAAGPVQLFTFRLIEIQLNFFFPHWPGNSRAQRVWATCGRVASILEKMATEQSPH